MAAISLAIVGKNFEPLYMREFIEESEKMPEEELFGLSSTTQDYKNDDKSGSVRHQFILHAALDRFEQLAGPPPGTAWRKQNVSGTDAMFIGLLCPIEEMRVYGE